MSSCNDEILKFAKHGYVLSSTETDRVLKLAEYAYKFVKSRHDQFLATRLNKPLLTQYSSDSTPLSVRRRLTQGVGMYSIVRRPKASGHYLLQRHWYCDADGDSSVLFPEPIELENQTTDVHFAVARSLIKTAREEGHQGPLVQHYVFDGALRSSMERRFRQLQSAVELKDLDDRGEGMAFYRKCLTLTTSVNCFAHVVHNSFKWSVNECIADGALMKNMWVSLEALKTSTDVLLSSLHAWLPSVLAFEDWEGVNLHEIYILLGFSGEWLELLCFLQLRFSSGKLKMAARFHDDPLTMDYVATAMLKAWRFTRWSDSRWAYMKTCCSTLLAVEFLGMAEYVEHICRGPRARSYHLRGYQTNCTSEVVTLCAVIAGSAAVSDCVLKMLLADDRLPRQLSRIDAAIEANIRRTETMSLSTWNILAALTEQSQSAIRDRTIAAAWTSATYMQQWFRVAREHPWSLLANDRARNLEALVAGARPLEENAQRIYDGMKYLGIPAALYLDMLSLLDKVSWATNVTEQAHTSAVNVLRKHSDIGPNVLKARSELVQFRPLLNPCKIERQLMTVEERLAKLKRKNPNHCSGRQLYVQELHTAHKMMRASGEDIANDVSDEVMRHHAERYKQLDNNKRLQLERSARDARTEEWNKLREEISTLETRRKELHNQFKAEKKDKPLIMSHARLSPQEINALNVGFDAFDATREMIDEARAKKNKPAGSMSVQSAHCLDAMCVPPKRRDTKPSWLRLVCVNRTFFRECMFMFIDEPGPRFFKMNMATINPLRVGFVECEMVNLSALNGEDEAPWVVEASAWNVCFRVCHNAYRYTDAWYFPDPPLIMLKSLRIGHDRIVSMHDWTPWESVVALFPKLNEQTADDNDNDPPEEVSGGLDLRYIECPWLLDFEKKQPAKSVTVCMARRLRSLLNPLKVNLSLTQKRSWTRLSSRVRCTLLATRLQTLKISFGPSGEVSGHKRTSKLLMIASRECVPTRKLNHLYVGFNCHRQLRSHANSMANRKRTN